MTTIVYNMDCMQGMKEYPDNYFDLAIVDPPYGINVGSTPGGGNKTYIPFGGKSATIGGATKFGGKNNASRGGVYLPTQNIQGIR